MTTLDRYVAARFLRAFAYSTTGLFTVVFAIHTFEQLRLFMKYDAAFGDALLYLLCEAPWLLSQILPMGCLVGALVGLTLLARNSEVVAMRAGGMPLVRISVLLFVCGSLVSAAAIGLQEFAVPASRLAGVEIKFERIKKIPSKFLYNGVDLWLKLGDRIIHADFVHEADYKLVNMEIVELDGSAVERRLTAATGRWTGEHWELSDVTLRTFGGEGFIETQKMDSLAYVIGGDPDEFFVTYLDTRKEFDKPYSELKKEISLKNKRGVATPDLETEMWSRTSLPFACAVMALIAVPFSMKSGRRGGLFATISLAVALGFAYWLGFAMCVSVGKLGALPPLAAAWTPNVIFGAAAIWLTSRAERG